MLTSQESTKEKGTMQQPNQESWAVGDIGETITHLEQQWASAAKANNPAPIALLLSEVFVEVDSTGQVLRRPEALERVKAGKWQVFEVGDVKVVVQGNVAIATGTWYGKGTLPDGKAIDAHERWLDTWHKNGTWKCMASASAPVMA
jgi:ketosteroid isomerase-like protein